MDLTCGHEALLAEYCTISSSKCQESEGVCKHKRRKHFLSVIIHLSGIIHQPVVGRPCRTSSKTPATPSPPCPSMHHGSKLVDSETMDLREYTHIQYSRVISITTYVYCIMLLYCTVVCSLRNVRKLKVYANMKGDNTLSVIIHLSGIIRQPVVGRRCRTSSKTRATHSPQCP